MGWDVKKGIPTADLLRKLKLDDVASDLEAMEIGENEGLDRRLANG